MTLATDIDSRDIVNCPGGNIDSYVAKLKAIPTLCSEEEIKYIDRFKNQRDAKAGRCLIMANMSYVVYIAQGFSGYGLRQDDLIQAGTVGLIRALVHFRLDVGVRLISYANHWIKSEICDYVLKNWKVPTIATTKAQRKLFFKLRRYQVRQGWLTCKEKIKISWELGVKERDVTEMELRMCGHDISYCEEPDDNVDSDRPQPHPNQFMEDKSHAEVDEHDIHQSYLTGRVAMAIEQLDERSQDIIRSRWLSHKKITLEQLSTKYSVSAERIRQLETAAKKHLKIALADISPQSFYQ